MWCGRLLGMIALVGSAIVAGPALAESLSSRGTPPRNVAALVTALIHENSGNVEIVTFADGRLAPVKVVRGGKAPVPSPVRRGAAGLVAVSDRRPRPARMPVRASTGGGTVEIVAFAERGERPVTVLRGSTATVVNPDVLATQATDSLDLFGAAGGADLDRVAFAVDGAESSHGADPAMWRPGFDSPQGPMQVSTAAAVDAGGGDRFDTIQNRLLGRAYLAHLYRRYGNWPDAVAAYNWGPGNLDAWIDGGRPALGLPLEVERYRDRVLRDGGIEQAAIGMTSATAARNPEK
jgi:transglycosylase-like protein with SLT domain